MALILLVVLGIIAIIVLNILKVKGVALPGVRPFRVAAPGHLPGDSGQMRTAVPISGPPLAHSRDVHAKPAAVLASTWRSCRVVAMLACPSQNRRRLLWEPPEGGGW